MAGEYSLKNGLQTDWILHDSTWKKGVDRNWKKIDWSLAKLVNSVVNLSTDIPPNPSDGDSFLVQTDNQICVWNNHTTQFDKIDLVNPIIFYNLELDNWYQWISGIISLFTTGGGGGDVIGPASSVDENIAVFDGTTGKIIKDGGMSIADILASIGTGTVTNVSVVTANGISGSVSNPTTTPAITLTLGAITPTSVNGIALSGSGSLANSGSSSITGFTGSGSSSGSNTGDQTSIVGITGTKSQFNTSCTDGDFLFVGDVTQYTDEMAQDAIGAMIDSSLNYVDGTPLLQRAALTGDITASAGSNATTLASIISSGGPTGSATVAPIITWDAKGRLTAVSSATITPAASSITGGAALTKTDDTNVTLTLGGSPTTSLLAATSLTLGWTGTLSGARGGTGVNNSGKTITLGGSLTLSGAFDLTLTQTGTTNVTLPTTGTLATLAGSETLSNKTLGNSNIVTLRDDRFTLQDDSDNTKQAVFQLSSIATGTTRTYTLPDATGTVQLIAATQTVSNKTYDNSNIFTISDDRLTLQDNSDNTKQGVFELSGITTGTTRTLTWPNVNGTIITTGDSNTVSDAILRQSAGLSVIGRSANSTGNVADITAGTDLFVLRRSGTSIGFGLLGAGSMTGAAYTMFANITNASAAYTEVVAKPVASQTYSGTITWTGTTAPSGSTNHTYQWQQSLKWVDLNISLVYATAGSALSQVVMTLPTDCPNPIEQSGLGASNEKLYSGTGWIDSAKTGAPPTVRAWLRVNSGDNGYELVLVVASNNSTVANVNIRYPTA